MRNYVIISHGELSKGFVSMLDVIMGNMENLYYYCGYMEKEDLTLTMFLNNLVEDLEEEDELIILSDLFGGSINNEALKFIDRKNTHLIAGVNANLMLSLLTSSQSESIENIIERVIEEAKKGIMYCNNLHYDDNDDIETF